jgi:hypothetical protein
MVSLISSLATAGFIATLAYFLELPLAQDCAPAVLPF